MRVEILHIDDCPNTAEAGIRVGRALAELGRSHSDVTFRLLRSSADAAGVPFAGSPTILIDGDDAFPTAERTTDLACRVYSTDQGLAGVPTVTQLVETLRTRT